LNGTSMDKCNVAQTLLIAGTPAGCLSDCTFGELNAIAQCAKDSHSNTNFPSPPEKWYTDETYDCTVPGMSGAWNKASLGPPADPPGSNCASTTPCQPCGLAAVSDGSGGCTCDAVCGEDPNVCRDTLSDFGPEGIPDCTTLFNFLALVTCATDLSDLVALSTGTPFPINVPNDMLSQSVGATVCRHTCETCTAVYDAYDTTAGWCGEGLNGNVLDEEIDDTTSLHACWTACETEYGADLKAIDFWPDRGPAECYCQNSCAGDTLSDCDDTEPHLLAIRQGAARPLMICDQTLAEAGPPGSNCASTTPCQPCGLAAVSDGSGGCTCDAVCDCNGQCGEATTCVDGLCIADCGGGDPCCSSTECGNTDYTECVGKFDAFCELNWDDQCRSEAIRYCLLVC